MAAASPEISVVIPTFRRPQLLERCLTALRDQTAPPSTFEIVVVDDAGGPEAPELLDRLSRVNDQLRWSSLPTNRGPAAARNQGVTLSRGRVVLFLDDDVIASPTLVADHLDFHRAENPDRGLVGYLTWLPSLTITPVMRWIERDCIQFNYERMAEGPQQEVWSSFYTCNLSMYRQTFEAAGGFDEGFLLPAMEDSDLGARLAKEGFTLEYRKSALAWHARQIDLDEICRRARQTAPARVRFAELHPELGIPVPEAPRPSRRFLRACRRLLVGRAARVRPVVWGRDLQTMHYRSEYWHAIDRGLRDR